VKRRVVAAESKHGMERKCGLHKLSYESVGVAKDSIATGHIND